MTLPDWVLEEWTMDQLLFAAAVMNGLSALCDDMVELREGQGLAATGARSGSHATEAFGAMVIAELLSRGVVAPEGSL